MARLVEIVAEERDFDYENAGSTTFQREDLSRGFEADTAFYLARAESVRGKKQIVLGVDPPPDLVTEVDVSHETAWKLPIFAAVGVAEVWHHSGDSFTIWILRDGAYQESPSSSVLPGLAAIHIQHWLERGQAMKKNLWLKELRDWVWKMFPK